MIEPSHRTNMSKPSSPPSTTTSWSVTSAARRLDQNPRVRPPLPILGVLVNKIATRKPQPLVDILQEALDLAKDFEDLGDDFFLMKNDQEDECDHRVVSANAQR
jgi:hypothetical protein